MYRVGFVVLGFLTIASAAAAEPVVIDAKTLAELVPGATVKLDTPLGTSVPVKYGANGLISGEAPALAFFLGAAADRGRWWIAEDRLCHKWFKWFDAEVQCLHLKRDGAKIFWTRDDGKKGTATLLPPEPIVAAPYALGRPEPAQDVTAAQTSLPLAAVPLARSAATPGVADDAMATANVPTAAKSQSAAEATAGRKAAAVRPATITAAAPTKAPAPAPTKLASLAPVAPTTPPAPAKAAAMSALASPAKAREVPSYNVIFRVAGVRGDDVLNVRQGPSAETPSVGNIPPTGQGVRLLGRCQMEWCPVVHGSVSGWVNSAYLVEDRKPER